MHYSHRLVILLFATASAGASARADVNVVATVPDLAALAQEIGGDKVRVTSLALHTQDPHFVDAKPSLVMTLNKADLLIAVGLDLEIGWLPVLQTGARNPTIQHGGAGYLECAGAVEVLEVPKRAVDRRDGDVHPGGNPHFTTDPRQTLRCAQAIAAKLAELDPANAHAFHQGAARLKEQFAARIANWEARMAAHRGTAIVTYHRSWVYLTGWLGLNTVAQLEPKPGVKPTPRHLAKVIGIAATAKARAILQENYYPSRTGALIAKKLAVALIELPAATNFSAGQTYLDHMEVVISRLEKGLSK
jgi:zinc/manganese transport system substrate-binding protein